MITQAQKFHTNRSYGLRLVINENRSGLNGNRPLIVGPIMTNVIEDRSKTWYW